MPGNESCEMVRLDCVEMKVKSNGEKWAVLRGGASTLKAHADKQTQKKQINRNAYVNDPVFGVMSIGAADIKSTVVVSNGLNHADMITAVIKL